jgi:hypothetical protein
MRRASTAVRFAAAPAGLDVHCCLGPRRVRFYGLLDRFQDFALHIVSVTELGPAA